MCLCCWGVLEGLLQTTRWCEVWNLTSGSRISNKKHWVCVFFSRCHNMFWIYSIYGCILKYSCIWYIYIHIYILYTWIFQYTPIYPIYIYIYIQIWDVPLIHMVPKGPQEANTAGFSLEESMNQQSYDPLFSSSGCAKKELTGLHTKC